MRSVHCVRAVFTALASVPGISTADVSIGAATIEHDGRVTSDALGDALSVVGYTLSEVSRQTRPGLPIL